MTPSTKMPPPGESRGRRALAALAALARASVPPPTSDELDGGFDAVRTRGLGAQARRSTLVRASLVGGLAAAAIVAVLVLHPERPPAPVAPAAIAYHIEGGNLVDGGYLRESGRGGVKLLFAEGTEFILTPGTRSRLRSVDASGARIAIEQGTASFQVTPAPAGDHRWQVDVGPFLVTVKGTVFSVSWDAAAERFELKLRHGRVTVSGPVSGGEISRHAGPRLVVDLPAGQTVISEPKPEEWLDVPGSPAPRADDAPAADSPGRSGKAVARPATPAPAGKSNGERRWAMALAAGDLDRILGDAERAGLKPTLEHASSDDLLALADAARYRRRMDLAREVLLAERRRFPDSRQALDAAFLLGRVEESSQSGLGRAIEWYDEYLKRAPAGTYASEALGRKMTLTSELEGTAQARPIAEEYLRRFPSGTYAGPARAFVRAP
jgi:TolA-binding protein